MILIYSTYSSHEEAKRIAKRLLKRRLVACVNILENRESIYLWENELVTEKEFVILAKTKESLSQSVMKEIKKKHSYDLPCVLSIPCQASRQYDKWVKKTVK